MGDFHAAHVYISAMTSRDRPLVNPAPSGKGPPAGPATIPRKAGLDPGQGAGVPRICRHPRGRAGQFKLHTVCEEAACPNIGECWTKAHATMMIMGDTCTRACAFCNVKTGLPGPLDPDEPAQCGRRRSRSWGCAMWSITSVDRDDLADGGAAHFAEIIARHPCHEPRHQRGSADPGFPAQGRRHRDRDGGAGPKSSITIWKPCRGFI